MLSISQVIMEITFKKVTEADYDAVLAIREDVYDQSDYLPALFHKMLPTHIGYAAVVNNKMVAFEFGTLIDDGTTILTRAGRVNKDYEGKGIFTKLTKHVLEQVAKSDARATRHLTVVGSPTSAGSLSKKGATMVLNRKFLSCRVPNANLHRPPGETKTNSALKILNKEDIKALIQDTSLRDEYMSEQRLLIDWVPYRQIESNLDFYSFEDFQCVMSREATMMSFSCCYQCASGKRLNIDFSGGSEDPSEIRKHIQEHIRKYVSQNYSEVFVAVSHLSSFNMEIMKTVLKESFNAEKEYNLLIYGFEMPLKS